MRIVGLDPGESFGYAWSDSGKVEVHQSGVWDLKPRRFSGGGMRFLRMRTYLVELLKDMPTGSDGAREGAVFYEEVRRHKSVDSSHAYGGYVATISSVCEELFVPYEAIPVGTVKKRATGVGNCSKGDMVEAAFRSFGMVGEDDNQADAIWILAVGLEELGYGIG